MKFSIFQSVARFDLQGVTGPQRRFVKLSDVQSIDLKFLKEIFSTVCDIGFDKSNHTKDSYISSFVLPLVAFIKYSGNSFQKSDEKWQAWVLRFYRYYLAGDWTTASNATRFSAWQYPARPILLRLQEKGALPLTIKIPKAKLPTEFVNSKPLNPLRIRTKRNSYTNMENKYLLNKNFHLNDDEFLTSIENECRSNINVLRVAAGEYWDAFIADVNTGRTLASNISIAEIDTLFMKINSQKNHFKGRALKVCRPGGVNSCSWFFAIFKTLINNSKDERCLDFNFLKTLPMFSVTSLSNWAYRTELGNLTSLSARQFNSLLSNDYLYRFSGILCNRDVAVACMLITIEHPNLNPLSILHSKIEDQNGKLSLYNLDVAKSFLFEVDKPRVKKRKSVILSPLAYKVVSDILEITAPLRRLLKRSGNIQWQFLFLVVKDGVISRPSHSALAHLCQEDRQSFMRLHPELKQNGFDYRSFSLSKIRNTLGILRWFETGSVVEMARCLGNTEKVTLKHYLPTSLLTVWNTRIIRRFQNILILISRGKTNNISNESDFDTISQCDQFIEQILREFRIGSSPIADIIHSRFNNKFHRAEDRPSDGLLNINLSNSSLAHLYVFSDYARKVMFTLNPASIEFRKFSSIIELSTFLHHCCEEENDFKELGQIIDVHALREAHNEAKIIQMHLSQNSDYAALSLNGISL